MLWVDVRIGSVKCTDMSVLGDIMRKVMLARCGRIERAISHAVEEQYATLDVLLEKGRYTLFGKREGLRYVRTPEQFARTVRRFSYSSFERYIERMRRGEMGVTTAERVRMFARSSGTSSRSKYIPVTRHSLWNNHLQGMADAVALYLAANPASQLFEGRTLTMAGGCHREGGALVGDLSALLVTTSGWFAGLVRAPSRKVALIDDFEAKCRAICQECSGQDIRALAGVPSWNMALLRRLLDFTGRHTVKEVWPGIELFMHGGVSFRPYRAAFADVMGDEIHYWENYNASEGFIATAERCDSDEMLLMPHYGCYYEFARGNDVVPLEGVISGREYAVLMSSENGLWRYELGDVVQFTSVDPYRIRLVGRTRQYINAFGEELMIGNVEEALLHACFVTGAVVEEFTISPLFGKSMGGCHRWVVEFVHAPNCVERFASELDARLRELNSDYDAKRRSVMQRLRVEVVPRGTFHSWQRRENRRKVPHMTLDSEVGDAVMEIALRRSQV